MKVLFAILFIILGPQAWAADPQVNVGGTRCSPASSEAAGRDAGIGPGMSGLWMSHWCNVKGEWWLQIGVVSASDVTSFPAMAHDWMAAINGTDYDKAMGEWNTKYAGKTGDPYSAKFKPIWYPSLAAIMAAKPADATPPPPPPKTCTVAPNGLAKTRQWYSYTAGIRATAGGGSVAVGLACQAPVLTEGAVTYAPFGPSFRTDRVTVCSCQ